MKPTIKQIAFFLILVLAMIISFIPHFSYQFPLHVDEWFHIGVAKEIATNNFAFPQQVFTLAEKISTQELLWHYILAVPVFLFQPSIFVWRFLPPFFAVLAVLSVYFFARRWGEKTALLAAFLVALLPSNVTIGGPVFLVPVNLSLIVIPLALHFAFDTDLNTKKNFFALAGLSLFLLLAHPPSAVVLLLALFFYSVLLFRENRKKTFWIWSAVALALLFSAWNYLPTLAEKGTSALSFPFWYFLSEIPLVYGVIPTIAFVAGFYLFLRSGKKEELAILAITVFLIADIVFFSNTGIGLIVPYQRAFIPLMLFMSLVGANALAKIEPKHVLILVLAAIFGLALFSHLKTPYYHVIDYKDFEAFEWIKQNTPKGAVVLLDPWKARALTPVAERRVFTVLPFGPKQKDLELNRQATEFLNNNCADTGFLKANKITVVYSKKECQNQELVQARENVYLLKTG